MTDNQTTGKPSDFCSSDRSRMNRRGVANKELPQGYPLSELFNIFRISIAFVLIAGINISVSCAASLTPQSPCPDVLKVQASMKHNLRSGVAATKDEDSNGDVIISVITFQQSALNLHNSIQKLPDDEKKTLLGAMIVKTFSVCKASQRGSAPQNLTLNHAANAAVNAIWHDYTEGRVADELDRLSDETNADYPD
ncbi:hypothetical protein HLH36_18600 [Gluconacetobacter aggeris]|uniref:Uncharacterized protein n=1 Tax=Gluconacetobacter aggeris TaxID=1286186 RepID=A0A7W4IX39_9PROT|nr:hypothetical protein [Gluconacetobacter aggeris]MBB2170327.1 hypothetical protein [Gluconacetobacter aggeris]